MIGKLIHHYKILEKLGSGGMGDVYLAEDTKLNRKVALKFLPSHFSADPEFKSRFQHEAEATAELDHPNIVTIYELGEHEGRLYIAMQHIKGRTLAQIISTQTLTVAHAIDIVVQLCEGLASAHQAGIVHRDIKPANILIDPTGRVRILDFGLAKSHRATTETKVGSTLGTVQYESPEQSRGEDVDQRSDLFSVGVVLYEMIAGKLPFVGEYDESIRYAISHEQPEPIARFKSGTPAELQRIVSKLLEKEPKMRYQSSDDVIPDLKKLIQSSSFSVRAELKTKWWSKFIVIGATAVLLIVSGYMLLSRRTVRVIPTSERRQLTFDGDVSLPRISSDGKYVAYKRTDSKKNTVFVQDISSGSRIEVFSCQYVTDMAWIPNGDELLIGTRSDTFPPQTVLVPRLGGQHRIYPVSAFNINWSPKGDRFAVSDFIAGKLQVVEKESGEISTIAKDGEIRNPTGLSWSPNGNLLSVLTFDDEKSNLWMIDLLQNRQFRVYDSLRTSDLFWSHLENAIYYLDFSKNWLTSNLRKVRIDRESGKMVSGPITLISSLQSGKVISVSSDCKKLVFSQTNRVSNLFTTNLQDIKNSQEPKQLTFGTSLILWSIVSPNGTLVAFLKPVGKTTQLFIIPVTGGEEQQVTYSEEEKRHPAWSPDGSQLSYTAWNGKDAFVSVIDVKGGNPRKFKNARVAHRVLGALTWAPGKKILFSVKTGYRALDPANGEISSPLKLSDTISRLAWGAKYLPDGKSATLWRATIEDSSEQLSSNRFQMELVSLDSTVRGKMLKTSSKPLNILGWSKDGKWYYHLEESDSNNTEIIRTNIEEGVEEIVTELPFDKISGISITPNCSTFVISINEGKSDIWMIENFDPEIE